MSPEPAERGRRAHPAATCDFTEQKCAGKLLSTRAGPIAQLRAIAPQLCVEICPSPGSNQGAQTFPRAVRAPADPGRFPHHGVRASEPGRELSGRTGGHPAPSCQAHTLPCPGSGCSGTLSPCHRRSLGVCGDGLAASPAIGEASSPCWAPRPQRQGSKGPPRSSPPSPAPPECALEVSVSAPAERQGGFPNPFLQLSDL